MAYIYKNGRRWRAQIDKAGVRLSDTFDTKREAEQWLEDHDRLCDVRGDLYPMQTLETKRWVLDRAFEGRWLLIFEHDPLVQAGYVRKDQDGTYFFEEVRAWQ